MNEQLLQEITNLEDQERIFEQQLANAETDEEGRQITNELNIVRNKLSERKLALEQLQAKEAEKQAVIESKVQDEAVPFSVTGVDLGGIPVEVITFTEDVVKADRKRIYNEHAIDIDQLETNHAVHVAELESKINGQSSHITALEDIIDAGKAANATLTRENGDLRDFTAQLNLEIADLQSKLANAAALIEEKNREIARLESLVADYQHDKVWGVRQEQPIDVTPEDKSSLQERADAVKKLFAKVEDWGSIMKVEKLDGSFELATRQEVAEQWEAADGSSSFRGETAETNLTAPEVVATVEVSVPDLTFPNDGDSAEQPTSADESTASAGSANGEEATLEARVTKLEYAVFNIVNDTLAALAQRTGGPIKQEEIGGKVA